MESKKIVIVGSTNMDMTVFTEHIPAVGETVLGGSFLMDTGGKGANQAVAAARLGGEIIFISRVGNDTFGRQITGVLHEEGINVHYVLSDEKFPSGVALIFVDKDAQNSIVVAPGANSNLLASDIESVFHEIVNARIVLMQLEIPMETVYFTAKHAFEKGIRVILNPAPMNKLSSELLNCIDILTPNETEAEILTGIKIANKEDAEKAAQSIFKMGVKNVVITMGASGALVCEKGKIYDVPSPVVKAIDSTAAGDVFSGALSVALAEGKVLKEAVQFACQAAAISVTKMGALSSAPFRNEMDFLNENLNGKKE